MISSSMGRHRDESVSDIAQLRFGVRIDQEGVLLHDFHTARSAEGNDAFVTHRYYIADAVFLVGLEGEKKILESIVSAINSPAYPLFLGRRSCPPSGRICLGIKESDLLNSLKTEEWQASEWYKKKHKNGAELELVMDSKDGEGAIVRDFPISFSQKKREHSFRTVSHDISGCTVFCNDDENSTQHDPFSTLGGR